MTSRLQEFQQVLQAPEIDLGKLASLCLAGGCPDHPKSLRPQIWRLLLGYEPAKRSQAQAVLKRQRQLYYTFVNELLVDPFLEASKRPPSSQDSQSSGPHKVTRKKGKGASTNKKVAQAEIESDPLAAKYDSYHADNLILEQIDKDVRRTLPEIAFFQMEVPHAHMSPLSPHMQPRMSLDMEGRPSLDMQLGRPAMATLVEGLESSSHKDDPEEDEAAPPTIKTRRTIFARIRHINKDFGAREHGGPRSSSGGNQSAGDGRIMQNRTSMDEEDVHDLHWEAMERILFVYAKLNPGIGYVQGMNELLSACYYVIANDDSKHQVHAEADVFFSFTALMEDCRELYEKTWDHEKRSSSAKGIAATLAAFMGRLKTVDKQVHDRLVEQEIDATYYAFRWFCCLYAQVFSLPEVIRLWDSILTSRVTSEEDESLQRGFAMDFACAMLVHVRERVLSQDFADNVKMLQQYPESDVAPLLALAQQLRSARLAGPAPTIVHQLATRLNITRGDSPQSSTQTSPSDSSGFPSLRGLGSFLPMRSPARSSGHDPIVTPATVDDTLFERQITKSPLNAVFDGDDDAVVPLPHHVPDAAEQSAAQRMSVDFAARPRLPDLAIATTAAKKWFGLGESKKAQHTRGRSTSDVYEEEQQQAERRDDGDDNGEDALLSPDEAPLAQLRNKSSMFMRRAVRMLNPTGVAGGGGGENDGSKPTNGGSKRFSSTSPSATRSASRASLQVLDLPKHE